MYTKTVAATRWTIRENDRELEERSVEGPTSSEMEEEDADVRCHTSGKLTH
jgi:hypothetical protein